MTSILEKIFARFEERDRAQDQSDFEKYVSLLEDIVDGKDHEDVGEIEKILDAVRKTRDDMKKDCELLVTNRRQWREDLHEWKNNCPDATAADKEIQRLRWQLAEMQAHVQRETERLAAIVNHASAITSRGIEAQHRLRTTCQDPELLRQKQEIESEMRELRDREMDLRQGINDMKMTDRIAAQLRMVQKWQRDYDRHKRTQDAAFFEQELRKHERAYDVFVQQHEEIKLEQEAIRLRGVELNAALVAVLEAMEQS